MKEKVKNLWSTLPGRMGCIALALLLTAGICFGIFAATDPYDCRIAEGVTVGGLDVAGMTRREAKTALKTALAESLAQPMIVRLPEEDLILYPEDTRIRADVSKAIRAAWSWGRKEGVQGPDVSLLPCLKWKEEAILDKLTAYATQYDTQLCQPHWELSGAAPELSTEKYDPNAPLQNLILTKGIPELHLDTAQVYGEILLTYSNAIPLYRSGDFAVAPEVTPEITPEEPDLDAIYEQISTAPKDDSLDLENYCFVPGVYGYGFDRDAAASALAQADYGTVVSIPMTVQAPEILGDAVYFRDVLGSCETKHSTDENRNTNLRLLCQALDGYILQPGEEFSYNATVGERTAERGYKPATAYSGTRMIKDIGGGVCQGSTTLYNCALLADLEILERVCHGAKVTYIQLGLDAAVNWNTKTDLRFKNNFHFPMMIKAEVADGYVKMQLLGTDEKDYYVEMYCKSGKGDLATYASSYKKKIHKETGEILSDELEARSTYYELS